MSLFERAISMSTTAKDVVFCLSGIPLASFRALTALVAGDLHQSWHQFSVEDRLLMCLMRLRCDLDLYTLEVMCGISVSAASSDARRVLEALHRCLTRVQPICWPTAEERLALRGWVTSPTRWLSALDPAFANMRGFLCPIGALDGVLFRIKRPGSNEQREYFRGHKKFHGMLFNMVTDWRGTIVYIGGPYKAGIYNDRSAFTSSQLYQDPHAHFSAGECLLADGGFVGDGPLLCPFSRPQRAVNNAMSQVDVAIRKARSRYSIEQRYFRSIIEHVFGGMKGKWSALHGTVKFCHTKDIPLAVKTLAMLWNWIQEHTGCYLRDREYYHTLAQEWEA